MNLDVTYILLLLSTLNKKVSLIYFFKMCLYIVFSCIVVIS